MNVPVHEKYSLVKHDIFELIPVHWSVTTIKHLCSEITDGAHVSPETENGVYDFVSTKDISEDGIDFENCLKTSATNYEYLVRTGCRPNQGDVLFSKDGTIGRTKVVEVDHHFVVASSLIIMRPNRKKLDPFFLDFLSQSSYVKNQVECFVRGAGLPRLSISNLCRVVGCFPPLEEQQAIANFLDAETSKIDALVAEQRRLIELLSEKRQAVISHAVTKGLDPNVRMKPSGIEWLGDVPEHWEVVAIRNLIRMRVLGLQDGNHGALHPKSSDYLPTGIPFLMASNLRGGEVDFGSCSFISEELASSLRIGPALAGDVLLSNKGTLGEVAIIPDEIEWPYIVLTPQVTYYRIVDPSILNREYVFYYLQSSGIEHQMRVLSCHQATRPSVSLLTQREMRFVVPPVLDQVTIAAYLKRALADFDRSIADVNKGMELLQERRTALISAAVTGKIDVREFATQEAL